MSTKRQAQDETLPISRGKRCMTRLTAACAAVLLIAVVVIAGGLDLEGPRLLWAQEGSACEVIDLGTLGDETESKLDTVGRWTTEDSTPASDLPAMHIPIASR